MDDNLIDAKLETVRAQNDARFAEVLAVSRETAAEVRAIEGRIDGRLGELTGAITGLKGQLDGISHRLDATSTKGAVWGAAVTSGLAVLAALLAALAFAVNRFDAGMSAGKATSEISAVVDQRISARFDQMEQQIERIGAAVSQRPSLPAPAAPATQP